MYKTLRVLIGFAALCMAHATQAQLIGNTPYSRYGIGEINENSGSIRSMGMAGSGVSAGNSYQANLTNPALLYYNSITNFDISGAGQIKNVESRNASQLDGNGNLYNLSLIVPVSKRWSSGIGVRPFSTINYEVSATSDVEGNPQASILRNYVGEGGLTEAYFAHGVKLFGGLTLGGSASFLFGNTTTESTSTVQDPQQAGSDQVSVTQIDRTSYSDFVYTAGINYRQKLNDKLFISGGGTYTFEANLDAERDITYERRSANDALLGLPTADEDTVSGSLRLPSNWRAGLSIDNGTSLTIAADFAAYEWSKFRDFNGRNDGLKDSYRASVGAEYTPDATAVSDYFKRITYRGGLYYNDTQYSLNGEDIKDMGVTAGFTLPVGRGTFTDMYQLNVALGYGRRGTTDRGLIKEDYFQFGLGFVINSRWFLKRRLD